MDTVMDKYVIPAEYDALCAQLVDTQALLQQEKDRNAILFSFYSQSLFVYICDQKTLFIKLQPSAGISPEETFFSFADGIVTEQLIFEADRPLFRGLCTQMDNGVDQCQQNLRLITKAGSYRWINLLSEAIRSASGQPVEYYGRLLDIHADQLEQEKIVALSQRDLLTQLYNRRTIEEQIEQCLQKNSQQSGALLLLDIDNFKTINNDLGFYFGDFILRSTADILRDINYPNPLIGRVGGDEFLILLPNATRAQANEIVHSILTEFRKISEDSSDNIQRLQGVTLSIGIAEYPDCGSTFQDIFQKADTALYIVKTSGKNSFRFYSLEDSAVLKSHSFINRYQIENHHLSRQPINFQDNLSTMVLEILNRSPLLSATLPIVLRVIGKQLGVDKVAIIEIDTTEISAYCTYEWAVSDIPLRRQEFLMYGQDALSAMLDEYNDTAILSTDNIRKSSVRSLYFRKARERGAQSFLHYATFVDGFTRYIFQYEHYNKTRTWNKKDIALIREISDIISNHLLRDQVKSQAIEMISKHINYDILTKLPTLTKFINDSQALIKQRPDTSYVIVYSDFKGFKYINDTLGYVIGDQVLCDYSNLLKRNLVQGEMICRASSDIFVSLLEAENEGVLRQKVDGANCEFCQKIYSSYCGVTLTINSGAYFLQPQDNLKMAIDNANAARKMAKNTQLEHCLIFDEAMRRQSQLESFAFGSLENVLGGAKEFIVYYQPKVCLKNRRIVGAEALIRWKREDGSLIPPDQFIPFFEANGMISKIDYYVAETVCRMLREWINSGRKPLPISINLSRKDFHHPNACQNLLNIVDSFQIPHELIEFEVTESVFMESTEVLTNFLHSLIAVGFHVSIDDFGSGYSSLNILSQVPATILKLDKVFLDSSDKDQKSKYILEQIVSMAKNVGLQVICEGVEREDQAEFCRNIGCDMAQGYLFARPMPEADLLNLLPALF